MHIYIIILIWTQISHGWWPTDQVIPMISKLSYMWDSHGTTPSGCHRPIDWNHTNRTKYKGHFINIICPAFNLRHKVFRVGPKEDVKLCCLYKIITIIIILIFLISQGSQYIGHMHPDVTSSITSSNVLWNKYSVHMMRPQTSCHYSLAMAIPVYIWLHSSTLRLEITDTGHSD